MIVISDIKFQETLKRWAKYLVCAVLLIAIFVLTGWTFDIKSLIHPLPKLPAMNPATAVVFVLFALSFFLLTGKNNSKQKQRAGKAFGFIVLLIGVLKASETVCGFDSKIDTLLFPNQIFSEVSDRVYAHMSPLAALCFILAGLSLLLLNYETRRKRIPAHYMALIIGYFGLASFIAYIFMVKAFHGDLTYVTMAFHTGISFIFMSVAILYATSDKGFMKAFTNSLAGSIVARRLIPIAVLIPVVLGLIRLTLELNGIVTYEVGITVVIMCLIVSLLGFIYYVTTLLNKRDYERIRSEQRFSTLFYKSPVMKVITDIETGKYVEANDAFADFVAIKEKELRGKTSVELNLIVHPEVREEVMKKLHKEEFIKNAEIQIISKNKEIRWVSSTASKINLNGKDCYLTAIVDITERKLVEEKLLNLSHELEQKVLDRTEALARSEARFRLLVENSHEAIIMSDENVVPFYRSPSTDTITGWTTEERLKLKNQLDLTHPDDLNYMNRAFEEAFANPGKPIRVVFRTMHKQGHYIWVEGLVNNLLHDPGLNAIVLNFHDITERKINELKIEQNEQRFRKLLENNYESISLLDEHLHPVYRSPGADRLTGWTTEERIKAGGLMDETHPDDVEKMKTLMKFIMKNPGTPVPAAFRTRHKKGHYVWLEGFITNMLHDESLRGILGNLRDVTERKQYEAKIEQSEQRFRKLLENNFEDITLSDENFIPFYRSPSAERITGWSTEERIKAAGGYDCTHPDDIDVVKKVMNNVLASRGKVFPVNFRTQHKDGHYIWLEGFFCNMLHDESLKGILANFRDVTVRKIYESKIEQSEQKFRNLLENNYEIISLLDEKFIPFYRSPAAMRFTGWTIEEGIKAGGVLEQTHPDDKQILKNVMKDVLSGKGKPVPVCFRARHKDGHYIWLEGFLTNMLHDESLKGIISNLRDVTERKMYEFKIELSEQRFRNLTEMNDEIIALLDEQFVPFYRSPAASRHLAWTDEDIKQLGGVLELAHPDDKPIFKNLMKEVLTNKAKPVPVCFRVKHKDGHYIWMEGFYTNRMHEESLKGIVSNLRDVTIRKQAEEEINKLTKELRELLEHLQTSREEERKYIAREIHDELGQRLTALKIDVSMMKKQIPANGNQGHFNDEIKSVISQIDKSIESVKRIATDLRPEILDHHGIIAAVNWQAEKFESRTGVHCSVTQLQEEINLTPEATTTVYRTVQEALTNIARHAKATAVSIFIESHTGGTKNLLVEIKDNGKGISEENIKSMTSLGLIGIRERVHLLKGTLSITGKPGKGTVVSVTLPIEE